MKHQLAGGKPFMNIEKIAILNITNWWPVSNEEWERLNYPEKFNKPVDKEEKKK